ncbi:MAG: epsG [Candidatus Saccharibacteria bacterium]|nr:epsG [Candidatus Saccharibacteria bacterium]
MSNEVSLLFYILSFSIAAFLMWWGSERKSKAIIVVSLLIPIIISALRFEVGTDYVSYVSMYNSLSNVALDQYFPQIFPKTEIGFYILIKLSDWITNSPVLVFSVSSALTVLFFYLGLRRFNVKHSSLVYFLYLLIIFPTTFNGIRQGLAAAICFYAISYIISRKPLNYFLLIAFAGLFHNSALFLAPLYFLNIVIKKNTRYMLAKIILTLGGVLVTLSLALPHIFEFLSSLYIFDSYTQYLIPNNDGVDSNFYSKFLIVIIVIILSKWSIPKNDKYKYYYFIVFAILEVLINTFGFSATIDRMSLYFSFFSIFLITSFTNIFKDPLGRSIMYFLIIMYGIVYFYLAYYVQGFADIFPYRFIY